jgi:hypothetical protein
MPVVPAPGDPHRVVAREPEAGQLGGAALTAGPARTPGGSPESGRDRRPHPAAGTWAESGPENLPKKIR